MASERFYIIKGSSNIEHIRNPHAAASNLRVICNQHMPTAGYVMDGLAIKTTTLVGFKRRRFPCKRCIARAEKGAA